jgi:hypothetical protein
MRIITAVCFYRALPPDWQTQIDDVILDLLRYFKKRGRVIIIRKIERRAVRKYPLRRGNPELAECQKLPIKLQLIETPGITPEY